jgi:hypothetical protein
MTEHTTSRHDDKEDIAGITTFLGLLDRTALSLGCARKTNLT